MPLTKKLPWDLADSQWSSEINPFLENPLNKCGLLKNISVTSGSNTINHGLGRQMQGWFVTDVNAAITLYRSQPLNNLTLTLTASGSAIISLGVF